LEVVLSVGNFLNAGTDRVASGFRLATLNKLQQTKSVDGKMDLLDFITDYLVSQSPLSQPDVLAVSPPNATPPQYLADLTPVTVAAASMLPPFGFQTSISDSFSIVIVYS
jgi:hypothetical protein